MFWLVAAGVGVAGPEVGEPPFPGVFVADGLVLVAVAPGVFVTVGTFVEVGVAVGSAVGVGAAV